MKTTWALIVQRRMEHARARELDDAYFRPIANRLRDFLEHYLEAPPNTVTMRMSDSGGRQGVVELSFTGEEVCIAVALRHDGAGVVEAMVEGDAWFDVSSPQVAHAGLEQISERVALLLLRPEVTE